MPTFAKLFAVIIGIAKYQNINVLPPAVANDAQDIHDLLIDPQHCGYPTGQVQVLTDGEATLSAMRQAFANLASDIDVDSSVLIYLSSHGGRIEAGPYIGEYILPVDARCESEESLANSSISGSEFTNVLRQIPARKTIVIFDCCHSGGIGQAKDSGAPVLKALPERYYDTLMSGHGRVIFASSRSTELSWVLPNAKNSLFTHHLLAGLRGGAPGPGGVIRVFDLFDYVQPLVTADQPSQHPIFRAELEENFPVALYRGGKAPTSTIATRLSDEFAYDVFISYRQQEPDKTWVLKTLLPGLEAQGLRAFIDDREFRLGAPIVTEIARGVEQSRYTLAVLSPNYLTSNFAEIENVLAEHLGLEQSQRRLLCIMRENCTPRLGIRARLWLDMTRDNEFDASLARLVYELDQRPTR